MPDPTAGLSHWLKHNPAAHDELVIAAWQAKGSARRFPFEETEQSKIFDNTAFGFWKVTVERPLRLAVNLSPEPRSRFRTACEKARKEPLSNVVDRVAARLGAGPHLDFNRFMAAVETDVSEHGVKLTAKRKKLLQTSLAARDEAAAPVIRKIHKRGTEADPLCGLFAATVNGRPAVVEFEPDTDLRDTEQIPLQEEGGIEAFLRREVLPYAADAWYQLDSLKIGYEISFTRYFYKPKPMRTLQEIRADILALEEETGGLLDEILTITGNKQ